MTAEFVQSLLQAPGAIPAVDIVVKATLVLATAGVVILALRRASAASRHLTWSFGLGAALAIIPLSFCVPTWPVHVLSAATETVRPISPAVDSQTNQSSRTSTGSPSADGAVLGEEGTLLDEIPALPKADNPSMRSIPAHSVLKPSWWWLWVAWFVGAMIVISTPIAGALSLRRWARSAQPVVGGEWTALLMELSIQLGLTRRVKLLRSDRAVIPMTWGWIRPIILLPAQCAMWDVDRRRVVLLHELAHIRRLDCLTHAMSRITCAVYCFHPVVWLAERRMRIERERACDDVVLIAGNRASEYAGHLLEIARELRIPRAASVAALTMSRPSHLEGRLLAILNPDRRRSEPVRGMAIVSFVAVALILLPLAALRLDAQASPTRAVAIESVADNRPTDPSAQMTLTGRVLDPSGKPVPGAAVMVIVRSKYASRPLLEQFATGALSAHEGRSDGSGKFRIELPRTTSARQYGLTLTALVPGFGMGWIELDPDVDPPVADVSLRTELIVRGRMFDVNGQPATGVALRTDSVIPVVGGTVTGSIFRPDESEFHRRDFAAWPGPAISDEQGRFTMRGLSRDLLCRLLLGDARFALPLTFIQTAEKIDARQPQLSRIKIESGPDPKPITLTLQPARMLLGRVTFADTGQPVPRAIVSAGPFHFEADAEGRFRVNTFLGQTTRFGIRVQSPDGAPYLGATKQGEWPKGAVEQSVDLALPRGAVVRGKITEEGTGRPVAGAIVRVTSYPGPPGVPPPSFSLPGLTALDGTYRVPATPGPGYVVVQGPDDDYVLHEFGADGGVYVARPGRRRFYAHAYRAVGLKSEGPELEVDLMLRRGGALRGHVVGPDGQPVQNGWVTSPLMLSTLPDGGWKMWVSALDHSRSQLRDGRFVLHGLDPNSAVELPAFFLDPEHRLGAVARPSGRWLALRSVTVQLEPCGTAKARLVTPDGKPLARYPALPLLRMLVAPGPLQGRNQAGDGSLFASEGGFTQLDTVNYDNTFQSDAEGRLALPALIPGATYRVVDFTPAFGGGDPAIRKEFTVKPGETLDLGDIVIARPRTIE